MAKNSKVDEWTIDWDNKEIYAVINVYGDDVERHYLYNKGDEDEFYARVLRIIRVDAQNEVKRQFNELMCQRAVR